MKKKDYIQPTTILYLLETEGIMSGSSEGTIHEFDFGDNIWFDFFG